MLRMIIFIAIIAAVTGSRRECSRLLTSMFSLMAVLYGIRILAYMSFGLLPCIIVFVLLGNVIVPFIKGFIDSFGKKDSRR